MCVCVNVGELYKCLLMTLKFCVKVKRLDFLHKAFNAPSIALKSLPFPLQMHPFIPRARFTNLPREHTYTQTN